MSGNDGRQAGGHVDRRVRRSQHALRHALLELVVERGYERVTVQDVIDRADVGRSTFYAHFRDKEDLFLSGIEEEIREAFGSDPEQVGGHQPSLWLFQHTLEHQDLYRALVRRRGGWPLVRRRIEETLVDVYERVLREASTADAVPVEAASRFVVSALLGLLTWWLDEGTPISAEEVDSTFRALVSHGTEGVLGVKL